jgi:hypothetical protein
LRRRWADWKRRVFDAFEHAVGFVPTRLALNFAAFWVLGFRVNADFLQHFAVAGHEMAKDVHQQDRMIGGDGIQVLPVRMALFFDTGVVIAPSDDPPAGLGR